MYDKIKEGWETVERITGINDLKASFSPYGWYRDANFRIARNDCWTGWWNDCYMMVYIWALSEKGCRLLRELKEALTFNGWEAGALINGGISFELKTMTKEESEEKAYNNLINGGRMSD